MQKHTLRLVAAGILTCLALGASAETDTRKAIATGLLTQGIVAGDTGYVRAHVAKDYIQHNPQVPDGRAGLLDFLDQIASLRPNLSINPLRILADGDMVLIHSKASFGAEMVVFDLFRFEGNKLVEHWDAIQPRAETSVSGHTMTDGETELRNLEQTEANRALVRGFVEDVLIGGDAGRLSAYIGDTYRQHNPLIGDGLEGLGNFMAGLAKQGISFSYFRLHNIVAEGNFVFVQSEGALAGTPTAFYDLFRVEEGRIVEHWDVIQEIPAEMVHQNGMF